MNCKIKASIFKLTRVFNLEKSIILFGILFFLVAPLPAETFRIKVKGPGYISVLLSNGNSAYTRRGRFRIDKNGNLRRKKLLIQPAVVIPKSCKYVLINKKGLVRVRTQNSIDVVGMILAHTFEEPKELISIEKNLLIESELSGFGITSAWGEGKIGKLVTRRRIKCNF